MKALKILLSIVFILGCLFNSCKNEKTGKFQTKGKNDTLSIESVSAYYKPEETCPGFDENVTWLKYGDIELGRTGYDGDLTHNYNTLNLKEDCGWKIYRGNFGGIGNTYEVISEDSSVVLRWEQGVFHVMELYSNWGGYFNEVKDSIGIGCSLKHFLTVYPEYQISELNSKLFCLESPYSYVGAYFNDYNKLDHLYVVCKTFGR